MATSTRHYLLKTEGAGGRKCSPVPNGSISKQTGTSNTMDRANLAALRKAFGLTQSEMATLMGLSSRAYQEIESGRSPLREIHVLAAERVALSMAVRKPDLSLAPANVRKEALELARLITGE